MNHTEIRLAMLRNGMSREAAYDEVATTLLEIEDAVRKSYSVNLLELPPEFIVDFPTSLDDYWERRDDPNPNIARAYEYCLKMTKYNHENGYSIPELKKLEKELSVSLAFEFISKWPAPAEDVPAVLFNPYTEPTPILRQIFSQGNLSLSQAERYIDLCIGYWNDWATRESINDEFEDSAHQYAPNRLESLYRLKKEIKQYFRDFAGDNTMAEVENTVPDSKSIHPVIWKGGPTALAWLYDALIANKMIDCSTSAFAAIFTNPELDPMPSNLKDYTKNSKEPKKQTVKDLYFAASNYKTEDTRS